MPSRITLPQTLWPFIKQMIHPYRGRLALLQVLCCGWALDQTLWPWLIGRFVDAMTALGMERVGAFGHLSPYVLAGAALWITIDSSFRLSGYTAGFLYPRLTAHIRMSMFDYAQHHSHRYLVTHLSGDIANKISDMPQSVQRVLELATTLFVPSFLIVGITVIIFANLSAVFALLISAWVIIHLGVYAVFGKRCQKLTDEHASARSYMQGHIVDSLSNHLTVRMFARHRHELDFMRGLQLSETLKNRKASLYMEHIKLALGGICFIFVGVGIMGYAFHMWMQNSITTGDFILVFNTCWNVTFTIWMVGMEIPNFFKELGICQQAMRILRPHDEPADEGKPALVIPQGGIVFDNVSFGYPDADPLFTRLSFHINPGEKVGLVGRSGSGKTTCVNLLLRLYAPDAGTITVDGQDITTCTRDSIRSQIAVINQDPVLFHRSVAENLRIGKPDASEEEMTGVLDQVELGAWIRELPQRLDTVLGERGGKISGGQRQRLAIARALLKNAPVYVWDEATSALDSVTEASIAQVQSELLKEQTLIVIAHRLSTIRYLDRILVFDRGQIVEEGTHDELLSRKGYYYKLWQAQTDGFFV